jgi:hypothetical protein
MGKVTVSEMPPLGTPPVPNPVSPKSYPLKATKPKVRLTKKPVAQKKLQHRKAKR